MYSYAETSVLGFYMVIGPFCTAFNIILNTYSVGFGPKRPGLGFQNGPKYEFPSNYRLMSKIAMSVRTIVMI